MSGDKNRLENFLSATQVSLKSKTGQINQDVVNVDNKAVGIGTGTQ